MVRDRLSFSLVLTLQILYAQGSLQAWFASCTADVLGVAWIVPMLATAVFVLRRPAIPEGRPATTSARFPSPAGASTLSASPSCAPSAHGSASTVIDAIDAMTLRRVKVTRRGRRVSDPEQARCRRRPARPPHRSGCGGFIRASHGQAKLWTYTHQGYSKGVRMTTVKFTVRAPEKAASAGGSR